MHKNLGGRRNRARMPVKEAAFVNPQLAPLQQLAALVVRDHACRIGCDEKAAKRWRNLLAFLAKLGLAVLDVFEPCRITLRLVGAAVSLAGPVRKSLERDQSGGTLRRPFESEVRNDDDCPGRRSTGRS